VIDSEGINYPVALADSATRFAYGGVAALPTVFVINSEGVWSRASRPLQSRLYETEVRALLGLPVAGTWRPFKTKGDIFLKHADRAKILPAST